MKVKLCCDQNGDYIRRYENVLIRRMSFLLPKCECHNLFGSTLGVWFKLAFGGDLGEKGKAVSEEFRDDE